jgi:hypothetical protein
MVDPSYEASLVSFLFPLGDLELCLTGVFLGWWHSFCIKIKTEHDKNKKLDLDLITQHIIP